jgi:hypothetical protein
MYRRRHSAHGEQDALIETRSDSKSGIKFLAIFVPSRSVGKVPRRLARVPRNTFNES